LPKGIKTRITSVLSMNSTSVHPYVVSNTTVGIDTFFASFSSDAQSKVARSVTQTEH